MAMKLLEKVKKRAEKAESILLDKEPNKKLNGKFSVNMLNTKAKDPTDAILGIKPDGTIAHFCISEMPHLLVAGTTGSGKSVLLNEILVTAMCHSTPDELKIGIVDPKGLNLEDTKNCRSCWLIQLQIWMKLMIF